MKNRYKYKLMDYFIMDEKSLAQRKKFVKDCEKFFKKESERASQRASKRLRKVREQASIDVPPVVRGQRRDFTNVGEQAKDRGALIKFYGATAGGLA